MATVLRSVGFVLAWAGAVSAGISQAQAVDPSLCVSTDGGCLAPGGLQIRVTLGESDRRISGAQFRIQYDPTLLTLLDSLPGSDCEPGSPFALELFKSVDTTAGALTYAVGVNFLEGARYTRGPAAVACIRFVPTTGQPGTADVCLGPVADSLSVLLVDDSGYAVEVNNSLECPAGPPALSCSAVVIEDQCQCDPNTTDCHGLDTECRTGVCNETTRFCEVAASNEGGSCNDADACTLIDRCEGGVCVGAGCTNPPLCMSTNSCLLADLPVTVAVQLGGGDRVIVGGQFWLQYDATELDLIDISPGDSCDPASPFSLEILEIINPSAGELFYTVGVTPGGPPGTRGPAALACVTFVPRVFPHGEVCVLNGSNPLNTRLVDEFGQNVPVGDQRLCPSPGEPPTLSCIGIPVCRIPAISEWGMVVLTLLLLIGAKIRFARSSSVGA